MPIMVDKKVDITVGKIISPGETEPSEALRAITDVGIS